MVGECGGAWRRLLWLKKASISFQTPKIATAKNSSSFPIRRMKAVAGEIGGNNDFCFVPDSQPVGDEAPVGDALSFTGVDAAEFPREGIRRCGGPDVGGGTGAHAVRGVGGALAVHDEGGALAVHDEGGEVALDAGDGGKEGVVNEDELVAGVDIGGHAQPPEEDVDVDEAEPYVYEEFVKEMLRIQLPSFNWYMRGRRVLHKRSLADLQKITLSLDNQFIFYASCTTYFIGEVLYCDVHVKNATINKSGGTARNHRMTSSYCTMANSDDTSKQHRTTFIYLSIIRVVCCNLVEIKWHG